MRILLISGSTREASSNTATLRTIPDLAVDGVVTELYDRLAALPAFNPDHDHDPLPPAVGELRERIVAADAVLFCSPEYAGTMPGSFKNLLDWTVGGGEMYEKPVGWINVAPEGRGRGAEEHLAIVLGYLSTVAVDGACVRLPVTRDVVGADGIITDPAIRNRLTSVVSALADHTSQLAGSDGGEGSRLADPDRIEIHRPAVDMGLGQEPEPELAGDVPGRVVVPVDDGEDFAGERVGRQAEQRPARFGRVSHAAELRRQPPPELEATLAVVVEPAHAGVPGDLPRIPHDQRLLAERNLLGYRDDVVEPAVRLVGRPAAAPEDHELVAAHEVNQTLTIRLSRRPDLET